MDTGLIIAIVVIAIILIIIIGTVVWWISTSNTFRRMKVKVEESDSGIDVALNKRFDLLTKSLAATKGYAKHEVETLEKVIELRGKNSSQNLSMEDKNKLSSTISEVERGLNIIVENYPNLKADQTFVELQKQAADCEEQLQAARRIYNSNASLFNQKRVTFPSSIVAKRIGFTSDLEFFEVEEGKSKDVEFNF